MWTNEKRKTVSRAKNGTNRPEKNIYTSVLIIMRKIWKVVHQTSCWPVLWTFNQLIGKHLYSLTFLRKNLSIGNDYLWWMLKTRLECIICDTKISDETERRGPFGQFCLLRKPNIGSTFLERLALILLYSEGRHHSIKYFNFVFFFFLVCALSSVKYIYIDILSSSHQCDRRWNMRKQFRSSFEHFWFWDYVKQ